MSLSGNLQDVSVADAMQFIHLGGRTGTLTLLRGDVKAEIGFHQGRIVNASSPGTKLVRLAALRTFEYGGRQRGEQRTDPPAARSVPPITPMPVTRSAPTPTPANGVGPLADEPRTRLQIVSTERELAERLAHVLP